MNKTLFLFISFSCILFSCRKKEDLDIKEKQSPINTISVIIDDQLWNSEVGDSIRNKFATPVLGLPQEEPLFTLKQYPVKLFEGFSTGSRSIFIVKKGNKNEFKIKKNDFSGKQTSYYIMGKSTNDIIQMIERNSKFIIDKMRNSEIAECQKINSDSTQNTQKIKRKLNIDLTIPAEYEYVMRKRNFIWLKKEITSGNTSLLLYQIPISYIHDGSEVQSIIKIRDSIGRLYIHGRGKNSKMITEEAYFPYFSKIKFKGYEAFETKGTWQMQNDYMSGPFINYAVKDTKNKRFLVLEGFCYVPSKEKRDLMFELESIIKSVQIPK